MRFADVFRRLVSHFIPTRSSAPETTNETKQHQSPASSATTFSKPTTITTTAPPTISISTIPTTMPGVTSIPTGSSKYDEIPGPLGLASASLAGKVALVTGAGMCASLFYLSASPIHPQSDPVRASQSCQRACTMHGCGLSEFVRGFFSPAGRVGSFTPTQVRAATQTRAPHHPHHPRPFHDYLLHAAHWRTHCCMFMSAGDLGLPARPQLALSKSHQVGIPPGPHWTQFSTKTRPRWLTTPPSGIHRPRHWP